MNINNLKKSLKEETFSIFKDKNPTIKEFLPSQEKSINIGLLENKNILVCTPTASGKTLIAELALLKTILEKKQKAVYVVPLRALATEKYNQLKKYEPYIKVSLSSGELDKPDKYLVSADLIITTSEKLDSLTRHNSPWLNQVGLLILDEIHLLNDHGRGPTLEILIVLFKHLIPNIQLLGLSATIGNPKELAKWLNAELVYDKWRPIKLEKGIYLNNEIEYFDENE